MSSNMTPSKKTIRRKPPPLVVDTGPTQPAHSSQMYSPVVSQLGRTSESVYPESIAIEEQIVNMSTPRPMGPKELPDYGVDEYGAVGAPPYPIEDTVGAFDSDEASPLEYRREQTTPSKIPSLDIPLHKLTTPTRPSRSSRLLSPGRYNTFNGQRNTPQQGFLRANTVSRSPSPKKIYGRSPSLIYDQFKHREEDSPFDSPVDPDFELIPDTTNYFNNNDWQYDPNGSYRSQKVYDDEFFDNESPTSNLFDYSILPDLPSVSTDGSGGSPKRLTLNLALSFVKGPGYTQSLRKKTTELPPVPLDLPSLPFTSSSLVSRHFAICKNVWSVSEVFAWCLQLKTWLHDQTILKKEFKKALIKLFVYHKRDVPLDTIGPNVDQFLSTLLRQGALVFDYGTSPNTDGEKPLPVPNEAEADRPTKTNPTIILNELASVGGVLTDLTNCYSYSGRHNHTDSLTENGLKVRCLSSRCFVNRIIDYEIQFKSTDINDIVLGEDWASHWKLTAEDLKRLDRDMSKKQSLLFDLLRYEQTFIQRAKCFVEVVGPEFIKAVPLLVDHTQVVPVNKFEDDVISPGAELLKIHQKSLFEPLLKILMSNGKFIRDVTDIADIYKNWAVVVKGPLLRYMGTVPMIEDLLDIPPIKNWVDVNVRNIERVKELRVNGPLLFMSTFNSRYQQLPLQLSDVMSKFDEEDSEYTALHSAVEAIKKTAAKVNEMKHHADNVYALKRIHKQLIWKNNVSTPNINFGSENRKFFYRGDLTRKGDLKFNSSVNHLIVLDNYILILDRVKSKNGVQYRVIENPIPVEFLLVEIKEKESPTIELNNITKSLTQLPQQSSPKHDLIQDRDDPSIYPFKVRYAGRGKSNAYLFSTKSEKERSLWINAFMGARSNLLSRLVRMEPYKPKLISNTCFAYEEGNKITKLQVLAKNDIIEKMASDSLTTLKGLGYAGTIYTFDNSSSHVVYSKVLAAAEFKFNNTQYYFVGTAGGVYCCDMIHEWKKVVLILDTTKISVLPSMNLVIMLNGGSLRYYPLDVLINYYYGRRKTISSMAISNEAVSFFEVEKHREITMLFYAKKKGNSSNATNFKVCVPETDNDGIFSAFKMVKKFYVQADCYGISIFNSSFAVHTSKGIEILELDKLLPRSVPELPGSDSKKIDGYARRTPVGGNSSEIDVIRKHVYSTSSKPMGMFKLNNNSEFLLVYNECAVFINKHGRLSRFSILRFDYRATSVAFFDSHLFIVCDEAIEVWSISDFSKGSSRLIQVIVGKDLRMIDNHNSLIFSMANPVVCGLQLVFKLQARETH